MTSVIVHHGDNRQVLKALADASVDAVLTDPPYGLSDPPGPAELRDILLSWMAGRDLESRGAGFMGEAWDAFVPGPEVWAECYRVLKPGGSLVAFFGARTYDLGVMAIRLAADFEVRNMIARLYGSGFPKNALTELKPALEPIVLARKPMIGSLAQNMAAHGTGALNIDGCRVASSAGDPNARAAKQGARSPGYAGDFGLAGRGWDAGQGRWPANVVHDGSEAVVAAFPSTPGAKGAVTGREPSTTTRNALGLYSSRAASTPRGDAGSAARFFYCAKASASERAGSGHPTIKPLALMRWLARLVMPQGGVLLDPFAGSGTTGLAAQAEGFGAILIESDDRYVADIHQRLAAGRS